MSDVLLNFSGNLVKLTRLQSLLAKIDVLTYLHYVVGVVYVFGFGGHELHKECNVGLSYSCGAFGGS